jgi:hypothetical protein
MRECCDDEKNVSWDFDGFTRFEPSLNMKQNDVYMPSLCLHVCVYVCKDVRLTGAWTFGEVSFVLYIQEIIRYRPVSRDSSVGIATSYWLDDRGVGVLVPVVSRIFTSPCCSDRLWGPPNLLSNGYWGLFPRGKSGRAMKLTTHLQLVQRSRKCGSIHPHPYAPSWRSA